jgi:hypothetical protein
LGLRFFSKRQWKRNASIASATVIAASRHEVIRNPFAGRVHFVQVGGQKARGCSEVGPEQSPEPASLIFAVSSADECGDDN